MSLSRRARRELREQQDGTDNGGGDSEPTWAESPDTEEAERVSRPHAEEPILDDDEDITRIVSRAAPSPEDGYDDSTRVASRVREADDHTRLSSRAVGGGEGRASDDRGLDNDAPDETRLSSRVRAEDGVAPLDDEDGPDADSTRYARPRDGAGGQSFGRAARGSEGPGALPKGFVPAEVSRGTFGEVETAYEPRGVAAPPELDRGAGEAQVAPAVPPGTSAFGLLTPAEAVRRREAARRRRLIVSMAAVAMVAAVVTLAVLGIAFLAGIL